MPWYSIPLAVVLVAVGIWLVRKAFEPPDGPVLPSHYNPERYARGGEVTRPRRVGVCQECGLWTDPERGFCPVCSGAVEGVVPDG